jgi:hypothetical protein
MARRRKNGRQAEKVAVVLSGGNPQIAKADGHYIKVTFFRGRSLRPVPPGASKGKDTRYLDVREGDKLDEAQMATWVKQAAALPGWVPGRPS